MNQESKDLDNFLKEKSKEIVNKFDLSGIVPKAAPDRKTNNPGRIDPLYIDLPNDHTLIDRIYADLYYYSSVLNNSVSYMDMIKIKGLSWLIVKTCLKIMATFLEWKANRIKVSRWGRKLAKKNL